MASIYDALLEEAPKQSEGSKYDSLLEPEPQSVPQDGVHNEKWNQAQADMSARAIAAGLPETNDSRQRLTDAITRTESAGFATPHFIGTPDEPTGDRGVTRDIENLATSLRKQESSLPAGPGRTAISKQRAYWEQEAAKGMSAEQWKNQTGDPEPLYPHEKPRSLRESLGRFLGAAQDFGKGAFSDYLPPEISQTLFGGSASGMRAEEHTKPVISPELATKIIGELPAYAGGNTEAARGIAAGAAQKLSEFSNPEAFAQLLAFAIPGVGLTYALNTAAGVPKQAEELGKIAGEHGIASKEFAQAATEAGIVDATGLAAGLHGAARLSESLRPLIGGEEPAPVLSDRLPQTTLSPEVIAETKPVAEPPRNKNQPVEPDGGSAVAQGDLEALTRSNAERLGLPTETLPPEMPIAPEVVTRGITGPVLTDAANNVMAEGISGKTHADLTPEALPKFMEANPEADPFSMEHQFRASDGSVLPRTEAWDVAKESGQIKPEILARKEASAAKDGKPPELESQDLLPSNEATGPAEPSQAAGATVGQPNVPSAPNAGGSQIPGTQTAASPEAATTSVGPGAEISEAQVPSHLRPSPELVELLNPSKSVPAKAEGIQLAGKEEGGALFSGGGKRTTVKAAGLTPKGDAEFIKIEPAWKRSVKGLERKGAADVIGETKNTVGKALADATKRHVDVEQELFGQLSAPLIKTIKGQRKSVTDKAFGEVATYFADKENGRPLPALSSEAGKLVKEWENIAEKTGQIATANNVQVFDPAQGPKGGYRPMHQMGKDFVPRMMRPEVERVMRDPESNPTLWNDLVDDFAKQRGVSVNEAANELRSESGRFSSSDFMGNLEMARTGKMPESFYDYDMRSLVSRFLPAFSERMSQIISYGQRLGPREAPLRENLWDVARKESANSYTQEWLINAEDQAVNLKGRGASAKGMARAQTIGSGLLLSSPTTTVMRNLLSGISATPELLGVRRSVKALAETARSSQAKMDAREIGAVRDNMGDFLHVDRLGESLVDDAIRATVDAGLKYSGYNGSEVFVRSHGALTASQFAKDGVAEIIKNPASRRSKEALALFKRMGADAEQIVAEGADWKTGPETRKFIRTVIRETQGGYRFDQVPLWANSNMGRFFYQFGRWGTQRARNIWNNGIKPALGEEVEWKGKTMNRRDVLPLVKMLGTTVVLGETFAGIAQLLFGRDRRDASVSEINAAWQDDDQKKAVALALERVVNDVIMAGTLGIWSQPIDWAKGFKNQSRLKNPSEPPGLGSVRAMMELGQDAMDQDGRVTRRDLLNFAASAAPGVKQVSDVARNVLDEPLYEAENDVRTLRAAGQRWARGSGVDISPSAKGDFRKSALAPEYEPIKEALLVGDTDRASFLSGKFLDAQPDRDKALKNLKSSVRQSQPFRVGPYTSEEKRADFMTWAERNLGKDDFNQAERIQERYMRAAKDVDLW